MRGLRRFLIAVTFGFTLIALPVVADDWDDDDDDFFGADVEQPRPADGINHAIVITECGKMLIIVAAIFEGPDDVEGDLLGIILPPGLTPAEGEGIMIRGLSELWSLYNIDGPRIELAEITNRFCL